PEGQETSSTGIFDSEHYFLTEVSFKYLQRFGLIRRSPRFPLLPRRKIHAIPAFADETEQLVVQANNVRVLEIPRGVPLVGIKEAVPDRDDKRLQGLRHDAGSATVHSKNDNSACVFLHGNGLRT